MYWCTVIARRTVARRRRRHSSSSPGSGAKNHWIQCLRALRRATRRKKKKEEGSLPGAVIKRGKHRTAAAVIKGPLWTANETDDSLRRINIAALVEFAPNLRLLMSARGLADDLTPITLHRGAAEGLMNFITACSSRINQTRRSRRVVTML